jgi:hypothetical protein
VKNDTEEKRRLPNSTNVKKPKGKEAEEAQRKAVFTHKRRHAEENSTTLKRIKAEDLKRRKSRRLL